LLSEAYVWIFKELFYEFLKRKNKNILLKRKIHTKSNFTISFTKVVRTIGLFMLKTNLDLFFRSINTPSRNSSVKFKEEVRGVPENPQVKNESAYDIWIYMAENIAQISAQ